MKQQNQLIALAALLVFAGAVWYYNKNDSATSSGGPFVAQNYQLLSIENPLIRRDELESSRKTQYKGNGRNPFSKAAETLPTVNQGGPGPQIQHSRGLVGPPAPAPDPPFVPSGNLKFFGYGTVPNGSARRAFFTDGEEVFIVAEGETLQGRYRIVKVNNTNLDIQEVSTGRHATMQLIEEPSSGGPT